MRLVALRPEDCTGCRACELICALHNYHENNPAKAALRVRGRFPSPGHYQLQICDQCGECAQVCPVGAIYRREDGAYLIDPAECTGCLACLTACPRGVLFTHDSLVAPVKCNGCGECVTYCPRKLLALSREAGNSA